MSGTRKRSAPGQRVMVYGTLGHAPEGWRLDDGRRLRDVTPAHPAPDQLADRPLAWLAEPQGEGQRLRIAPRRLQPRHLLAGQPDGRFPPGLDVEPEPEARGRSGNGEPHASSKRTRAARKRSVRLKNAKQHRGRSTGTKKRTSKAGRSGSQETKQCRECLRTKPISKFPNPRRARCIDCGGQPQGKSVRTVSGGLPSLGRGR